MNDADTTSRVVKRAPRRRHDSDFKAQVLHACRQPGACVAAIAREHGLNANVVHRWRANDSRGVAPSVVASPKLSASGFLAVGLLPEPHAVAESTTLPDIRIELQRGNATAVVHWPVQAAASCAAWLHEWLRRAAHDPHRRHLAGHRTDRHARGSSARTYSPPSG